MPRGKIPRKCECKIKGKAFKPTCVPMSKLKQIAMHREELEVLRLCDLNNLTQTEAGSRMGVSRGTVQRILSGARKKVATALSKGQALVFK